MGWNSWLCPKGNKILPPTNISIYHIYAQTCHFYSLYSLNKWYITGWASSQASVCFLPAGCSFISNIQTGISFMASFNLQVWSKESQTSKSLSSPQKTIVFIMLILCTLFHFFALHLRIKKTPHIRMQKPPSVCVSNYIFWLKTQCDNRSMNYKPWKTQQPLLLW